MNLINPSQFCSLSLDPVTEFVWATCMFSAIYTDLWDTDLLDSIFYFKWFSLLIAQKNYNSLPWMCKLLDYFLLVKLFDMQTSGWNCWWCEKSSNSSWNSARRYNQNATHGSSWYEQTFCTRRSSLCCQRCDPKRYQVSILFVLWSCHTFSSAIFKPFHLYNFFLTVMQNALWLKG